jgi:putative ABC transport system ATP-binding protein
MIRLEGVSKRYPGAEIDVLSGIDLAVGEGEFVSIVGRSGSGKTTLLNLIGGLDGAFSGAVAVGGSDLGSLDDGALSAIRSRKIGFVFQSYHLLEHLNCGENVSLASLFARDGSRVSPRAARDRANELLAVVGLDGRAKDRPSSLSGGERQRVALARALFRDPPILLCDEPTGNLDTATGREIIDLLCELHRDRGMTIITATHDEVVTSAADRVLELEDGILVQREGG